MLLHRLPWQVGTTFPSILDSYVQYVGRNFGEKTHIIFDGYLNSNTKDHCHRKRFPIQSNVIDFVFHMTRDCRKVSIRHHKLTHLCTTTSRLVHHRETTMVKTMAEKKRIYLLLSYALLGCDPVSGLHAIGKA